MTLALVLAAVTRHALQTAPPAGITATAAPITATAIVDRHLMWADEQAAAGLDPQLVVVREFFAAARFRTRAYATEVLGWDSKLTLAGDYLTGARDHERYMRDRFASIVFADADLEALVQHVVASYLRHVDDVESQMLVALKADLAELSPAEHPAVVDRAELESALQAALQQATTAVQAEFRGMVGRELVSWVAAEVLTVAAAQLATSAGILGTGAASGWATFGAGIVIGLIVDVVVTEIYHQQFDPVGELSATLEASLTQIEALILEGTTDAAGLQQRLQDYTSRRNVARREAIQEAVLTTVAF